MVTTAEEKVANSAWVAGACWAGAPFTGGLLPVALLIATWKHRGSLTRRHALRASAVWAVLMAIWAPVFLVGWLIPAFMATEPRPWALVAAISLAVVGWSSVLIGVLSVWLAARRTRRDATG